MIRKFTLLGVIMLFILSSCCIKEGDEIARYPLSTAEKALLPYAIGDVLPFEHSAGFAFHFEVTEVEEKWEKITEPCEWNCCGVDFYSYEVKKCVLFSAYPFMEIHTTISKEFQHFDERFMEVRINNDYAAWLYYDSLANFLCDDTTAICHDSLVVNDTTFYKVYEKSLQPWYGSINTESVYPKTIVMGEAGLIQIKMSNNETYSLID